MEASPKLGGGAVGRGIGAEGHGGTRQARLANLARAQHGHGWKPLEQVADSSLNEAIMHIASLPWHGSFAKSF